MARHDLRRFIKEVTAEPLEVRGDQDGVSPDDVVAEASARRILHQHLVAVRVERYQARVAIHNPLVERGR